MKIELRAATVGYLLRPWNVDCSNDKVLNGGEYHLALRTVEGLYGIEKYSWIQLKLELPIRAIVASDFRSIHQEGWVTNPGIFYYYRDSLNSHKQRLKMTVGATANFATGKNNSYLYGVDSEYATLEMSAYEDTDCFTGISY